MKVNNFKFWINQEKTYVTLLILNRLIILLFVCLEKTNVTLLILNTSRLIILLVVCLQKDKGDVLAMVLGNNGDLT